MPFAADSIWFNATSTGTGSFVVASAVSAAYRTPATASVPNGATLHYSARTATEFENGEGIYTTAGVTLTRTTIFASSNANAVVNFASVPTVAISPLAEDNIFPPTSSTDNAIVLWDGTAADAVKDSATLLSSLATTPVNLASAVTGDLPYANLAQGSARSVLGVTGNATADNASLQSSAANQILNSTATTVVWTATPTVTSLTATSTITGSNLSGTNTGDEPTASTTVEGVVELATAAEYRADTAVSRALALSEVWDAMAEVTLTDAATVAWDMSLGMDFAVTITATRAMGAPTNLVIGKKGRLRVVHGAVSTTLTWHADYALAGGTAPTLSTANGAEDILYYDTIAAGKILITAVALAIS